MLINNSAELNAILNIKIPKALDNTMQRLVLGLQQTIDEEVYSYPYPMGEWHGRTGQFGESWTSDIPQRIASDWWESKISNSNYKFSWNSDRDEWGHGNGYSPLTNDELDEIINERDGGSNFGFPALQRDYWGKYRNWLDENLDKIFKEECIKLGIPLGFANSFYATIK